MPNTIEQQLMIDLKQSMIEKNEIKRETIRYLRSEIHYAKIAQKKSLNETDVIDVLSKQAQQRRDSIEIYRDAGKNDLVTKEEAELEVILCYLPQPLTRTELEEIISEAIQDLNASSMQDMGKVMSNVMPKVKGKAEGREVSEIVNFFLKKNNDSD